MVIRPDFSVSPLNLECVWMICGSTSLKCQLKETRHVVLLKNKGLS
jgi:hypothetical protein